MRKIALALSLIGIFTLILLLHREPRIVKSLEGVHEGEVVRIEGTINAIGSWGEFLKFTSSDFFFVCDCSASLLHKTVIVEGPLEIFEGYRYIRALRVKLIEIP